MKRRDFIKSSMALATAASVAGQISAASGAETEKTSGTETEKNRVKNYRTLGRTGMKIGDISFGAGKLPSASLVLRAVERGMNYFDTAPDYGPSETLIGEAMPRLPDRSKIHIASKFCQTKPYPGHLPTGSSEQEYIAAVEGSLKRLKTDYLDVVFVHALGENPDFDKERQRLLDPNMLKAYDRLRRDGKVRFLAASSHGPHNMERLLLEAVNSGHYDLIMPAFNFMKFPKVPEVLQTAAKKGVGVVAMKTLAGAKESGIDLSGVSEHAAFKWVLKHPEVGGLVVTFANTGHLELYLQASGQTFTAQDQKLLDQYAARHGQDYCRTGCGDCEAGCPQGVPIASILRYQMYFEDYHDEKQAMQAYSALEKNAAACQNCADAACNQPCPYGLPVATKLRAAHRQLSFDTVS
ncbi:MAG: aldo/keto reductase [Magnetococcales bacterium]|nr:aldo/keto reductase [Magnetococcales bacterium]